MILYSNCKINIGLNIIKKRSDGFHDIESIMYPLKSLSDVVEVVENGGSEINYSESGVIVDCPVESNLCVKAARLMQVECQIGGVDIHLHKTIPFGAGLGGGSANATAVITAINNIFDLNLSVGKMKELASKLGSDTAFFVENTPQFAEGRGEVLSSVNLDLSGKYIVLVKPNVAVSTADAYAGVTPSVPMFSLKEVVAGDVSTWRDKVVNDFECSVFAKHPILAKIKSDFYAKGAVYASMSGSGSSVYGIFDTKPELNYNDDDIFVHQSKL